MLLLNSIALLISSISTLDSFFVSLFIITILFSNVHIVIFDNGCLLFSPSFLIDFFIPICLSLGKIINNITIITKNANNTSIDALLLLEIIYAILLYDGNQLTIYSKFKFSIYKLITSANLSISLKSNKLCLSFSFSINPEIFC